MAVILTSRGATARASSISALDIIQLIFTRKLGVYGGMALPTSIPNTWVMHCCTSNATQDL